MMASRVQLESESMLSSAAPRGATLLALAGSSSSSSTSIVASQSLFTPAPSLATMFGGRSPSIHTTAPLFSPLMYANAHPSDTKPGSGSGSGSPTKQEENAHITQVLQSDTQHQQKKKKRKKQNERKEEDERNIRAWFSCIGDHRCHLNRFLCLWHRLSLSICSADLAIIMVNQVIKNAKQCTAAIKDGDVAKMLLTFSELLSSISSPEAITPSTVPPLIRATNPPYPASTSKCSAFTLNHLLSSSGIDLGENCLPLPPLHLASLYRRLAIVRLLTHPPPEFGTTTPSLHSSSVPASCCASFTPPPRQRATNSVVLGADVSCFVEVRGHWLTPLHMLWQDKSSFEPKATATREYPFEDDNGDSAVSVAEWLVAHGADVNAISSQRPHATATKALPLPLPSSIAVATPVSQSRAVTASWTNLTLVQCAAAHDDLDCVKLLLAHGAAIELPPHRAYVNPNPQRVNSSGMHAGVSANVSVGVTMVPVESRPMGIVNSYRPLVGAAYLAGVVRCLELQRDLVGVLTSMFATHHQRTCAADQLGTLANENVPPYHRRQQYQQQPFSGREIEDPWRDITTAIAHYTYGSTNYDDLQRLHQLVFQLDLLFAIDTRNSNAIRALIAAQLPTLAGCGTTAVGPPFGLARLDVSSLLVTPLRSPELFYRFAAFSSAPLQRVLEYADLELCEQLIPVANLWLGEPEDHAQKPVHLSSTPLLPIRTSLPPFDLAPRMFDFPSRPAATNGDTNDAASSLIRFALHQKLDLHPLLVECTRLDSTSKTMAADQGDVPALLVRLLLSFGAPVQYPLLPPPVSRTKPVRRCRLELEAIEAVGRAVGCPVSTLDGSLRLSLGHAYIQGITHCHRQKQELTELLQAVLFQHSDVLFTGSTGEERQTREVDQNEAFAWTVSRVIAAYVYGPGDSTLVQQVKNLIGRRCLLSAIRSGDLSFIRDIARIDWQTVLMTLVNPSAVLSPLLYAAQQRQWQVLHYFLDVCEAAAAVDVSAASALSGVLASLSGDRLLHYVCCCPQPCCQLEDTKTDKITPSKPPAMLTAATPSSSSNSTAASLSGFHPFPGIDATLVARFLSHGISVGDTLTQHVTTLTDKIGWQFQGTWSPEPRTMTSIQTAIVPPQASASRPTAYLAVLLRNLTLLKLSLIHHPTTAVTVTTTTTTHLSAAVTSATSPSSLSTNADASVVVDPDVLGVLDLEWSAHENFFGSAKPGVPFWQLSNGYAAWAAEIVKEAKHEILQMAAEDATIDSEEWWAELHVALSRWLGGTDPINNRIMALVRPQLRRPQQPRASSQADQLPENVETGCAGSRDAGGDRKMLNVVSRACGRAATLRMSVATYRATIPKDRNESIAYETALEAAIRLQWRDGIELLILAGAKVHWPATHMYFVTSRLVRWLTAAMKNQQQCKHDLVDALLLSLNEGDGELAATPPTTFGRTFVTFTGAPADVARQVLSLVSEYVYGELTDQDIDYIRTEGWISALHRAVALNKFRQFKQIIHDVLHASSSELSHGAHRPNTYAEQTSFSFASVSFSVSSFRFPWKRVLQDEFLLLSLAVNERYTWIRYLLTAVGPQLCENDFSAGDRWKQGPLQRKMQVHELTGEPDSQSEPKRHARRLSESQSMTWIPSLRRLLVAEVNVEAESTLIGRDANIRNLSPRVATTSDTHNDSTPATKVWQYLAIAQVSSGWNLLTASVAATAKAGGRESLNVDFVLQFQKALAAFHGGSIVPIVLPTWSAPAPPSARTPVGNNTDEPPTLESDVSNGESDAEAEPEQEEDEDFEWRAEQQTQLQSQLQLPPLISAAPTQQSVGSVEHDLNPNPTVAALNADRLERWRRALDPTPPLHPITGLCAEVLILLGPQWTPIVDPQSDFEKNRMYDWEHDDVDENTRSSLLWLQARERQRVLAKRSRAQPNLWGPRHLVRWLQYLLRVSPTVPDEGLPDIQQSRSAAPFGDDKVAWEVDNIGLGVPPDPAWHTESASRRFRTRSTTPLLTACERGWSRVVHLLLVAGADPNRGMCDYLVSDAVKESDSVIGGVNGGTPPTPHSADSSQYSDATSPVSIVVMDPSTGHMQARRVVRSRRYYPTSRWIQQQEYLAQLSPRKFAEMKMDQRYLHQFWFGRGARSRPSRRTLGSGVQEPPPLNPRTPLDITLDAQHRYCLALLVAYGADWRQPLNVPPLALEFDQPQRLQSSTHDSALSQLPKNASSFSDSRTSSSSSSTIDSDCIDWRLRSWEDCHALFLLCILRNGGFVDPMEYTTPISALDSVKKGQLEANARTLVAAAASRAYQRASAAFCRIVSISANAPGIQGGTTRVIVPNIFGNIWTRELPLIFQRQQQRDRNETHQEQVNEQKIRTTQAATSRIAGLTAHQNSCDVELIEVDSFDAILAGIDHCLTLQQQYAESLQVVLGQQRSWDSTTTCADISGRHLSAPALPHVTLMASFGTSTPIGAVNSHSEFVPGPAVTNVLARFASDNSYCSPTALTVDRSDDSDPSSLVSASRRVFDPSVIDFPRPLCAIIASYVCGYHTAEDRAQLLRYRWRLVGDEVLHRAAEFEVPSL